jgi:hypothetical protein
MIDDPRPNDWYSFAEGAGYVDSYVSSQTGTIGIGSPTSAPPTIEFDIFGFKVSVGPGGISTSRNQQPSFNLPTLPGLPNVGAGAQFPGGIIQTGQGPSTSPAEIPGGIYEQNKGETDWDEVYRQYRILNEDEHERGIDETESDVPLPVGIAFPTQIPDQENDVAFDWGDIFTTSLPGVIDMAANRFLGPEQPTFNQSPQSPTPAKVTMDTRTGRITPCRRRRRRRLLTPTDLSDLAALQAIVGKGDALKLAVAKAVRR